MTSDRPSQSHQRLVIKMAGATMLTACFAAAVAAFGLIPLTFVGIIVGHGSTSDPYTPSSNEQCTTDLLGFDLSLLFLIMVTPIIAGLGLWLSKKRPVIGGCLSIAALVILFPYPTELIISGIQQTCTLGGDASWEIASAFVVFASAILAITLWSVRRFMMEG